MKTLLFLGLVSFSLFSCAQSTATDQRGTEGTAVMQDIDQASFKAKMDDPDVVILDVRTPAETAAGKIAGARELDFRAPDFAAKVKALDKNKTYLVYCQSGGRSGEACSLMAAAGFREVYNLEGGYGAWEEE